MKSSFLVLFFSTIFSLSTMAAGIEAADDLHLLLVNGVAEVTVEPNMVILRIESWAKAPTAKAAQEQQAIQYGKIKSAIEKFKIKKDDIQTENFSVYPEYTWDQKNQQNKVTAFRATNTVVVTHRKIEEAGAFIDSVTTSKGDSSGINVQNISWDFDKKSELETSALADAIKNARTKADKMAQAAGVTIKTVRKIQHTSYQPPVPRPVFAAKAMMESDSAGMGVAPTTEMSSGQVRVRVEVQLEYQLIP